MATERLRLERFLPYRLSVLANTVSRALAESYEQRFGLTIQQWRVIAVLGPESALSASEIADRSVMDKVSVSRAVARLVDDGRLLRTVDSHDRRRSVLRLSRRGRVIYERIIPLARAYERDLLRALDRDDRADLDRVLTRLTQRARSISPPSR